ncbi:MAG: hypothetical protein AVDCRST_MAG54-596, partial [uncultured Actinomycetospora sp.]
EAPARHPRPHLVRRRLRRAGTDREGRHRRSGEHRGRLGRVALGGGDQGGDRQARPPRGPRGCGGRARIRRPPRPARARSGDPGPPPPPPRPVRPDARGAGAPRGPHAGHGRPTAGGLLGGGAACRRL